MNATSLQMMSVITDDIVAETAAHINEFEEILSEDDVPF